MKKSIQNSIKKMLLQYWKISILAGGIALTTPVTNAQKTLLVPNQKALDKRAELQALPKKGPDKILLSDFKSGKIKPQTNTITQANALMYKKIKLGNTATAAKPAKQTTYTFTGKGSWFTATNWENNLIPPARLNAGGHVVINGSGPCMFSNAKLFTLTEGSSLEVKQGKDLYVSIGNNLLLQGGTITNNGKLTVLSGVFSQRFSAPGSITNNGEFKTTGLSKVDGQIQNYNPPPKGHYKKADAKSGAAFVLDKDASKKPDVQ